MHSERRANGVNPLPPTRTTRLNGGPRPATSTPLPPFRLSTRTFQPPRPVVRSSVSTPDPADGATAGTDYSPAHELAARFHFDDAEPGPEAAADDDEDEPAFASAVVDDFPLDAFIIPEGAARLPAGLWEADRRQRQRANQLAARLEALARRLRQEGYSALARQTVHGDPVDALIAGILAGYLAGVEE